MLLTSIFSSFFFHNMSVTNETFYRHVSDGMILTECLSKHELACRVCCWGFSIVIRPSKTGRIMGSPVAGGRRPVLCPEHISKTTLPRVMKFHGWILLIQGECSAQES